MDLVSIPPLIVQPRPKDEDECGGYYPVIHIKTKQFSYLSLFKHQRELYHLYNDKPITVLKKSSQLIEFPILFITALPALCIITVDSHLYRYNLFYNVSIIPTNDTYPHIILFNYTNKSITLNPNQLWVSCQIVLAGKS